MKVKGKNFMKIRIWKGDNGLMEWFGKITPEWNGVNDTDYRIYLARVVGSYSTDNLVSRGR